MGRYLHGNLPRNILLNYAAAVWAVGSGVSGRAQQLAYLPPPADTVARNCRTGAAVWGSANPVWVKLDFYIQNF